MDTCKRGLQPKEKDGLSFLAGTIISVDFALLYFVSLYIC